MLTAVVEGQKNPVSAPLRRRPTTIYSQPKLGKIGWSQADIHYSQIPKLSRQHRAIASAKWSGIGFAAHLAVNDDAARERLLFETLRLVIAG